MIYNIVCKLHQYEGEGGGGRGRDRMVAGFTTTYAISAYHHWRCEFESRSGRGVQHYVIKCVSDLWFSPGTPVSSTNKTDHQDITKILLKVAFNAIKHTNKQYIYCWVRLLSNYNIKYICTIYTRLYTCLTSIPRFALREKVTLRLLKFLFSGVV